MKIGVMTEIFRLPFGEALCGDFMGCKMYYEPDASRADIEKEKRVMEVCGI